ncbi:MAG: hypothetical protein REI93_10290, partial [Pedobacter sp.]|nr:hypothetical protein [Pedobacter sp.]
MHLDHVTIRTHELEATRNFMVEVFGLVEGSRPASIVASVEGYWLYEKDWPLIHLIKSNVPPGHSHESAEAIDHFAFVMEDYKGFEQKLIRLGISYQKMHIPE